MENGARLLVDAEYVSLNPGISLLAIALMLTTNQHQPVVWNTYQCYLKAVGARNNICCR